MQRIMARRTSDTIQMMDNSGGSFERPGWKKMIEDIEAGEIATVIAKDMSRIGRNYLEVGYYTEVYFGQKDIRFHCCIKQC